MTFIIKPVLGILSIAGIFFILILITMVLGLVINFFGELVAKLFKTNTDA